MSEQAGQKRRRSDANGNTKRLKRSLERPRNGLQERTCQVCTLMLSHQGLQHLNSPNGFLHHTRTGCAACANRGCRMCKLILFAVCKDHDEDWKPEDRLLFRNSQDAQSFPTTSSDRELAGIYSLRGAFESSPTVYMLTIQLFAKQGQYSLILGDICGDCVC